MKPKCTAKVCGSGSYHAHWCGNTAKHDPDENGVPTRCGVHSEAAKAKRKAKSDARYEAYVANRERKREQREIAAEAQAIVRAIAEGHNDPRTLCADWVNRKDCAQ